MKAVIICAEGLEECEALVTHDLLYRAGIEVKIAGFKEVIESSRDVRFLRDFPLEEIQDELYDCLILPGGVPGVFNLEGSEIVQKMIDRHIEAGKYVAAICAAPSILIHKGLLNDGEFTCSPGFESGKKSTGEKAHQKGKIITGIGLGGVFEFSALIIKNLISEEKAQEVLKKIKY